MRRSIGLAGRTCAVLAAIVMLSSACTRSANDVEVSAGPSGGSSSGSASEGAGSTGSEGTTATAATDRLDAGDFGDLTDVCQAGKPSGSPDKGVTASEINVGTVSDKGSTIRPGLTKEMWDVAVAFTKWCNDHGGIGGRKLNLTDLDAKLMEYPAAVTKGCQMDFAMVGGGAGLDNGDGGARVKCGLVNIAGYAVSAEARTAALQVFPLPLNVDEVNGGPFRVLAKIDPAATKKLGTLTADLQSIVITKDQDVAYAEKQGYRSVYDARYSVMGESNWRPFVQNLKDSDVQVLEVTGEPDALIGLQKAMKTIGWYPKYTLQPANFYDAAMVSEGGVTAKDTWVRSVFHPMELASKNPATADYLELMKRYNPNGRRALLGLQGLSAWLLFAKAAKACGDDLTRDCLLAQAKKVTTWTGGGLHATTDPGGNGPAECFVSLKVTTDGFVYDRKMTDPNKGIFNCDADNVAKVSKGSVG